MIEVQVQVENGRVQYDGDFAIAGVPGTAAPIKLSFIDPMGSVTGKLLPTGNASDVLDIPGFGQVEVSIVDAANPLVFVPAAAVGLSGTELPAQIDGNPEMLRLLETVRGAAALKLGFVSSIERSAWESPAVPKMTIVAEPKDYEATSGAAISRDQIDLDDVHAENPSHLRHDRSHVHRGGGRDPGNRGQPRPESGCGPGTAAYWPSGRNSGSGSGI